MATKSGKKVRCLFCGSENVEFQGKMEDERYGYDTDGPRGTVGRTYLGNEVVKDYRCHVCGQQFQISEIRKD